MGHELQETLPSLAIISRPKFTFSYESCLARMDLSHFSLSCMALQDAVKSVYFANVVLPSANEVAGR